MYIPLLIMKYLWRRRIAWVSLLAVILCTAMVLVVISVMGGWLRMFRASFQGLSGDVIVMAQEPAGFAYYQEMTAQIEKLPDVGEGNCVPVIQSVGLLNLGNQKTDMVMVWGYDISKIGRVNKFPQSLYWQYTRYANEAADTKLTPAQREAAAEKAKEGVEHPTFDRRFAPKDYAEAFAAANPKARPEDIHNAAYGDVWGNMITGVGVIDISRNVEGQWTGRDKFKYQLPCKLTVLTIPPGGKGLDLTHKGERNYWIVDDSHTGVYQADSASIYVPFHLLQKDLEMGQETAVNDDGTTYQTADRVSQLFIKAKPGADLMKVRGEVEKIVDSVCTANDVQVHVPKVRTWEQTQQTFIDAIEHEKLLVTFLFGIISVVAVFLIFCIFYMIVVEKTRDIGTIKAVGATSRGIAAIFIGYGLVIGLLGAGLGYLASYLVVTNINELHAWLGRAFGVVIWNPEVYSFDYIPNTMDPKEVMVILSIAVLSSVMGAVIPAIRAARMDPIEALRWE